MRPFSPFLTPLFVTPAGIPRYVVVAAEDGSRPGADSSKFDNISPNFEVCNFFLEVYDAERILSCMPWTAAATAYRGMHAGVTKSGVR